jgi:hypothetical protein
MARAENSTILVGHSRTCKKELISGGSAVVANRLDGARVILNNRWPALVQDSEKRRVISGWRAAIYERGVSRQNLRIRALFGEAIARAGLVDLQQHGEAFADFIDQPGRGHAGDFDIAFFPGHATRLIGQYDACDGVALWNGDLKRITSRPAGNWTQDAKTRPPIVGPRRQHDGRAMTTLFMAERGIEIYPDKIASIGAVVTRLRCQQAAPTRVRNADFPV